MCGVLHDVVNLHIQNLYYIRGQIIRGQIIRGQIKVDLCLVGHRI